MRIRWTTVWRFGALSLVAAVAGANVLHIARKTPPAAIGTPAYTFDPLSWHEERFLRLRERAAALGVRGTIGYFGDTPEADDDYYYAQFALLPLVLDLNPTPHDWALANLRTTSPGTRLPSGWHVVQDCGAGVFLLRNSAR